MVSLMMTSAGVYLACGAVLRYRSQVIADALQSLVERRLQRAQQQQYPPYTAICPTEFHRLHHRRHIGYFLTPCQQVHGDDDDAAASQNAV